jgi:hypothetical protein
LARRSRRLLFIGGEAKSKAGVRVEAMAAADFVAALEETIDRSVPRKKQH